MKINEIKHVKCTVQEQCLSKRWVIINHFCAAWSDDFNIYKDL